MQNKSKRQYEPVLINFNIPKYLKLHLDHLCFVKCVSRTSVLNSLVEKFIREENIHFQRDSQILEDMRILEDALETSVVDNSD